VRKAFLCGKDTSIGKDYSHRKQWVQKRLAELSQIFAIDICAFAIMSNHYHTVLKINPALAKSWSDKEVIERWQMLYHGNTLTKRFSEGEVLSKPEMFMVRQYAKAWRKRLSDISWFMKCLNEWLARKANAEDKCKGRFWEGRYKCQALLDESALLACMVYVDLNPIRAKMASRLQRCDFTSIKQRIELLKEPQATSSKYAIPLIPLDGKAPHAAGELALPNIKQYIALVEWTGKAARDGKKGRISNKAVPCLEGVSVGGEPYLKRALHFERLFARVAGSVDRLRQFCEVQGLAWVQGVGEKAASS